MNNPTFKSTIEESLSDSDEDKLIKLACSKLKEEDYTHRGFLKPLEISLKTYKT
jgi:hypothetical protein